MVDKHELDKIHNDRVKEATRRIEKSNAGYDELVLSERVNGDLDLENVVLHSFNEDAVKAYLPYSDRIYVMTCHECVKDSNFESYKKLLQSGSVVPVLASSYKYYPDNVVDVTYSHNHVGPQEYSALRRIFASGNGHRRVCGHCVGERGKVITAALERSSFKTINARGIDVVIRNLHPYMEPDFELIDELESAIASGDRSVANSIVQMSWTLSQMRSASIFNAPLIVPSNAFENLPEGYSEDIDQVREGAVIMTKKISDGLALQIPSDISLDEYIEVAADFRPRIAAIIGNIASHANSSEWKHSLDKEIMNLNAETSKLSRSKRYIALAAAVEFYRNNQIKINAALVAGSLSLSGNVLGCVGGGAAVIAGGIAQNRGMVASGPATARAVRAVKNSVQPTLDKLIAAYTGASPMAVSVVSLKRDLEVLKSKT